MVLESHLFVRSTDLVLCGCGGNPQNSASALLGLILARIGIPPPPKPRSASGGARSEPCPTSRRIPSALPLLLSLLLIHPFRIDGMVVRGVTTEANCPLRAREGSKRSVTRSPEDNAELCLGCVPAVEHDLWIESICLSVNDFEARAVWALGIGSPPYLGNEIKASLSNVLATGLRLLLPQHRFLDPLGPLVLLLPQLRPSRELHILLLFSQNGFQAQSLCVLLLCFVAVGGAATPGAVLSRRQRGPFECKVHQSVVALTHGAFKENLRRLRDHQRIKSYQITRITREGRKKLRELSPHSDTIAKKQERDWIRSFFLQMR